MISVVDEGQWVELFSFNYEGGNTYAQETESVLC